MTEGQSCKVCARFNVKTRVCRNDNKRKDPDYCCSDYKIILADHYVRNIWDEWKDRQTAKLRKGER